MSKYNWEDKKYKYRFRLWTTKSGIHKAMDRDNISNIYLSDKLGQPVIFFYGILHSVIGKFKIQKTLVLCNDFKPVSTNNIRRREIKELYEQERNVKHSGRSNTNR